MFNIHYEESNQLLKNAVFWDVAPCRSCVNWHFGGTYCLHLQGRKIREQGTSVSRWLATQDLHSATSQKTALFIVTAVKTSNPTIDYWSNPVKVKTYLLHTWEKSESAIYKTSKDAYHSIRKDVQYMRFEEGSMFLQYIVTPHKITQCHNPDDHSMKYNFLTKFGLLTVSCWILALACSSTLKVEATWHYLWKDRTLHNHCCKNIKSYIIKNVIKRNLLWPWYISLMHFLFPLLQNIT
jgi:hypothetical protein